MDIFSVKDFSAATSLRILKFGTKLDSDELYRVTKTATHCISVNLFVHFSSSPIKISVYWSQCFQILCTLLGRLSVLCK